ncbi:protein kinase [Mycobacterium sp. ACS1612]|uniref:serine/threonine-protein kinase n=1 Tax=Mycobacterium sp. ACS1612 TaxID=1834117 RepID=UPI0007FCA78A|nr:serine/threonine-protein kinase [Mycobacterium sp. ACS1612]OBF29091.1 protein kinase [Mycobacterium sp. ACS1612]
MTSAHGGSRLGTRFGPYELNALIGVGGMGEVYRAYDTVKERTVAVKVLRAEMAADPNYQERFRRESRVAARLQEPHVIPVHDFGDIDGVLYIDMRLVEGGSLKDELRANGPIEPGRATRIISQVAAALDAAHADGLVHRDIKPENVLLTPDDFAYLVDFGIAHGGGDASMTMTGLIIGSCAYMSAERFSGGQVGPSADVYSLTCLLYEMLTGRPPFETGDLRQLMTAHMFSPPPRPSIMRRGIPRAFDDVIAKGMAKKPGDRFSSAGEMAKAATAALSGGPVPPAPAPVPAAAPGAPPSTMQFSAMYANPAGTGYTPYPPPALPAPEPVARTSRFRAGQVALVVATILLFGVAVVLAMQLFDGDRQTAAPPPTTTMAVPPPSTTTQTETVSPSTTTTTPPTTTTSTTPTTSGTPLPGVSGSDAQGFVGHAARCDAGSTPTAAIRTAQSLAVICQTPSGSYYYHGERLRDGANVRLANAVPNGGGFDVVNPEDGASYEVRPDHLTIRSNGHVDSNEPALEYSSGNG